MCRLASDYIFSDTSLSQLHQQYQTISSLPIFGSTKEGSRVSNISNRIPTGQQQTALIQKIAYNMEYAIDIISKVVKHKVVVVWWHNKQVVNKHNFVYRATCPVDFMLHHQLPRELWMPLYFGIAKKGTWRRNIPVLPWIPWAHAVT